MKNTLYSVSCYSAKNIHCIIFHFSRQANQKILQSWSKIMPNDLQYSLCKLMAWNIPSLLIGFRNMMLESCIFPWYVDWLMLRSCSNRVDTSLFSFLRKKSEWRMSPSLFESSRDLKIKIKIDFWFC